MTDEITRFTEILKSRVDKRRFRHSLGVMNEAETLAERHGADKNKAKIAGLLHDITKNLSVPEHLSLIRAHSPNEDPEEVKSPNLLHAITAPIVLRNEFGIKDPEILSAVRRHTTARPGLTLLEKILFVADFTEPNRQYADVEYYRKAARENIDKALFLGLRWGLGNLLARGEYIYKNTWETYNYYILNFHTADYITEFQGKTERMIP